MLTALSLCFATIPEELPILIAAVLAVGALSLSSHHIYVKNLRAQVRPVPPFPRDWTRFCGPAEWT